MTQKALKELLEAVEAAIQAGDWKVDGACDPDSVIRRSKEALAQPEQEPVAFASHGVINWIADKQFQHEADLYTTPPQQTWVGLNDDEIDYLIHLAYTGDEEFVQTIEAKLKEKNLPCIKPKWIGLTEKEHTDIAVECGCMSADWVFYGAAVERKLKERNT